MQWSEMCNIYNQTTIPTIEINYYIPLGFELTISSYSFRKKLVKNDLEDIIKHFHHLHLSLGVDPLKICGVN